MSDERQKFIDGLGDTLREYQASQENVRRIMTPLPMYKAAEKMRSYLDTIPEYDDGPRTLEDMEMLEKLHQQEEAPVAPTTRRPYPNKMNRTITHPDGFVEFDQHVFEDPERDEIMGNTWQALRRLSTKRAFEQEEAKRRGAKPNYSSLGVSIKED